MSTWKNGADWEREDHESEVRNVHAKIGQLRWCGIFWPEAQAKCWGDVGCCSQLRARRRHLVIQPKVRSTIQPGPSAKPFGSSIRRTTSITNLESNPFHRLSLTIGEERCLSHGHGCDDPGRWAWFGGYASIKAKANQASNRTPNNGHVASLEEQYRITLWAFGGLRIGSRRSF
jgi:hypothetical protein